MYFIVYYRYGKDNNGKLIKQAIVYTKDEHGINKEHIDKDALQTIQRLNDFGFTAYLVGGAVRDLALGLKKPKDFDIVTNATPSKIKKVFRNSRIIGKRFRLVHVVYGTKIFEVSTFRSNKEGSVGNEFGTIEEDVLRRDFSINALYYDANQEQIIDYVGGFRDIKKHILRPIISLNTIFTEDPVRMLRAIKYSATTNAIMSHSLKAKIKHSASLISQVSPSRLTEELLKIINSSHAYDIFSLAMETDLFMYLQPSAAWLMSENKEFEKQYFSRLKELDMLSKIESNIRLGKKLYYLIFDFMNYITDWNQEIENKTPINELYGRTWTECRNFVLPMNPQRRELDLAIRLALKEYGINIRLNDKKSLYKSKSKN